MNQRLTGQQINLMRVWEVDDPLEDQPAVRVSPQTRKRLLKQYQDAPSMPRVYDLARRLGEAPGYKQLALMFRLRAREFYPEVRMLKDPAPVRRFRQGMYESYVLNYCGRCHTDAIPGGFTFYRRARRTDRTFYSNFYVLSQYRSAGGEAMIERRRPTESLLLQYGLPRQAANTPHPPTANWQPRFNGLDDPRYKRYARILNGLYDRPRYAFDTELPIGRRDQPAAATRPTPRKPDPATTRPASEKDRTNRSPELGHRR
jgi:hypothetical protein